MMVKYWNTGTNNTDMMVKYWNTGANRNSVPHQYTVIAVCRGKQGDLDCEMLRCVLVDVEY